jgi:hypothetical protein
LLGANVIDKPKKYDKIILKSNSLKGDETETGEKELFFSIE